MRDDLAPEVERESVSGAAEHADEVIFPGLDRFLGYVSSVVIGRDQLVGHAGLNDGSFECCGGFIVEDLVARGQAAELHTGKGAGSGFDHFAFRPAFHWLDPGGVAVDVVQYHLVPVAAAGDVWELACLVTVDLAG